MSNICRRNIARMGIAHGVALFLKGGKKGKNRSKCFRIRRCTFPFVVLVSLLCKLILIRPIE